MKLCLAFGKKPNLSYFIVNPEVFNLYKCIHLEFTNIVKLDLIRPYNAKRTSAYRN